MFLLDRDMYLCVSERHLSVAYVGDAKLEDAEVMKICAKQLSYQLVASDPKLFLYTDVNWQACFTQPTNFAHV